VKWGAINTAVLIISSLTAAWAVRAAQLGQKRLLCGLLAITILCACGFLGIKYVEYSHKVHEGILFGAKFDPCISSGGAHLITRKNKCPGTKASACTPAAVADLDPLTPGWETTCKYDEVTYKTEWVEEADPTTGAKKKVKKEVEVSRRALPTCELELHGGHGPPHAKNPPCWEFQRNPWVCRADDKNTAIDDGEVAALVHYGDHKVRGSNIKIEAQPESCKTAAQANWTPPASEPQDGTGLGQAMVKERPRPTRHHLEVEQSMGPPPPHTNMFFSIYFAMTGLHGLHVLVGVFIFIWLLIRAWKGHFTPDYFGPIDYAALYWHLVDLIWIFLFPLLYLIH
jgi:cytochrome c oxidase subunit 3